MEEIKPLKTLVQAVRYFANPESCHEFLVNMRWPDGVICPRCGFKDHYYIKTRRIWKCKGCKKDFSVRIGTIFEDSALPLDTWLVAMWLCINAKNSISSYELHRALDVTQKTAWFMLHRIRLVLKTGTLDKLEGEVEADESFIGGRARNMHPGKRKAKGRGTVGKAVVMGLLERHGEVRAKVVPDRMKETLQAEVRENVLPGAQLFTDELKSYDGLIEEYAHQVINHAECYAKGKVHTNGLENFWSLLKRGIRGTYVSVEPFHLGKYLDEEIFRFNNRHKNDGQRFVKAVKMIEGRRLTYRQLVGDEPSHSSVVADENGTVNAPEIR